MYYKISNKAPSLLELPETERPRGKLLSQGSESLSNTELLAVLLSTSRGSGPVMGMAARLLGFAGGRLSGLAGCQPEEYMSIAGIDEANACRVSAAIELGRRIATTGAGEYIRIGDPGCAADLFMEELRYLRQEVFMAALINVKCELMMKTRISMGGISSSSAGAREVFRTAVQKGAYAVIVAHNHPSGDPTPSSEDIAVTKRLIEAGKVLGIQVLDHIVIGDGRYVSLKEKDMID